MCVTTILSKLCLLLTFLKWWKWKSLQCKLPRHIYREKEIDYPANAFECGQQDGGNYSCPCGIQAQHHNDFTKAISMPISTLEKHESMVQNGILWKTRRTGLLKSITKAELLQENKSCNLYIGTSYQRPTKDSMLSDLTKELHGIHRRPALTSNSSSHIKDIAPE